MATTASTGNVGTPAPDFTLPEVSSGKLIARDSVKGSHGLLVLFICRHCPYVVHVESELARLGKDLPKQGIGVVGISANDAKGYPEDAPSSLAEQARKAGFTFPYLYDESQAVARAYGAACTPDPYLFDAEGKLFYRGQLDDARPANGKRNDGADLRAAVDALLAKKAPPAHPKPAIGCGIKWK